jgi:hypothetical protein
MTWHVRLLKKITSGQALKKNQKSKIKNQKSKIKNQKSKIKNQSGMPLEH